MARIEIMALVHLIYGTMHAEMAQASIDLAETYLSQGLVQQVLWEQQLPLILYRIYD